MDKAAVRQMGALTLAYIGDSVYDIYVRRDLIEKAPNMPAHGLHRQASRIVCAAGQARAAHHILDRLTEEEMAVFRRGRNANHATVPKHADMADFRAATGLEALLGALYLMGETERLSELLTYTKESWEET